MKQPHGKPPKGLKLELNKDLLPAQRVPGMTDLEYLLQYGNISDVKYANIQGFVDMLLQRLQNFTIPTGACVLMDKGTHALLDFHVLTPTDNAPDTYLV